MNIVDARLRPDGTVVFRVWSTAADCYHGSESDAVTKSEALALWPDLRNAIDRAEKYGASDFSAGDHIKLCLPWAEEAGKEE